MTEKAKTMRTMFFPNMNSPLHILFMAPFAMMSLLKGFWIWNILSLLFGFLAAGLVAFNAIPENRLTGFLTLAIFLFGYFPTFANVMLGGQWGLCLLFLSVLIWLAARKEKYIAAGIVLGLAMSTKILFGLFLLYFFVRRAWKLLAWSLITFFIVNVVGLFIVGISTYKQHILNLEVVPQFMNASWNASFTGFFTRIFGGAENIPLIMMPGLAHILVIALSILLVIGIIRGAWPQAKEASLDRYDIGFCLTTVSMLLISPVGWMYYFPILIISLFVIWNASSSLGSAYVYRFSVGFFWAITSIPTELILSDFKDMNKPILWFTSAGYYFYGLCGFSTILLFMLSRTPTDLRTWFSLSQKDT
jgi:hypothetical protein